MTPGSVVPNPFSKKPPEPEPEPAFDEDELSPEQIAIVASRWRNLTDAPEKGGGGFTPEEAFKLVSNPSLDWHFAAYLRSKGCEFEMIVKLTS